MKSLNTEDVLPVVQKEESYADEIKKMLNRSKSFEKNTRKNQKKDKMKPWAINLVRSKDMLRWDSLVQKKRLESDQIKKTEGTMTQKGN